MKGRSVLGRHANIADALKEVEDDLKECATCYSPALEGDKYCQHCRWYWDDVNAGLFDEKAD